MLSNEQLDAMTDAFIQAALCADAPEGARPRPATEARTNARLFCAAFTLQAGGALDEFAKEYGIGQAGHSLYLTCAGRGAGFGDFGEDGATLLDYTREDPACGEGFRSGFQTEFYLGWFYFHLRDYPVFRRARMAKAA